MSNSEQGTLSASKSSVWDALSGMGYGGDYNPEQWPVSVQEEDVELMKQAGVNFLSVGIFSWSWLEEREGHFTFDWLDAVLDRLHVAGIKVALATATAAPPPWLVAKHPEILPVLANGSTLGPGSRRHYSPSSSVYRSYAAAMTRRLAERYKDHPALALWHVDNELGCHVGEFFGPEDATAFRAWLERRYGTIETLNQAWGTAFWSQRFSSFEQIEPPRQAPTMLNPTQQLDFKRFSSWALIDFYDHLLAVLREVTPNIPATTNLMASSATKGLDYFDWAGHLDVIANDHYLVAADPERHIELAFGADLTRGIAGGKPWILMEHSTSAVNWQPRNAAKVPGEMARNSLSHVARGADSVMFFQWRQSQQGAEKFHSAMVPHAGTNTRVWREVVDLGQKLCALEDLSGSQVHSDVALVFDYEAWWASELDAHPSVDVNYLDVTRAFHRELFLRGISADFVHPSSDLSAYKLVIVATLYTVSDSAAATIAAAAKAGATVLISYFSGITDPNDSIRLGGYPGAFRELLGVKSEEFLPMLSGESHAVEWEGVDVGTSPGAPAEKSFGAGSIWSEDLTLVGAQAIATFTQGRAAGIPAITRNSVEQGSAWYLTTFPDSQLLATLVTALLEEAHVLPSAQASAGVELVRRVSGGGKSYLFAINHTDSEATLHATGRDLLSGADFAGTIPAGHVVVLAE